MDDRTIARNIGLAVGVIMLVALGLVTLSTIIGNNIQNEVTTTVRL